MTNPSLASLFSAVPAEQLDLLFQQLPLGVALFDANARLVRCNPQFAALVAPDDGLKGNLRPGLSLLEIAPGRADALTQYIARALAGETVRADATRVERGGQAAYWDEVLGPVLTDGQVRGFVYLISEVTERAEAMQKVQEAEAGLRSLVENARHFAIYRVAIDPQASYGGRVVFVSPSLSDIVGIEDPYRYDEWFEAIHPADQARILEANRRSLALGEAYNQVTRVFHKRKNDWVWVHTISNPYHDASGRLTHFDGMVIDLTDQVTLREAERRRAAAEGLRDILRMINANYPLDEILQTIAVQARSLLEASSTMIRQVFVDENRVQTVASCGLPADFDAIRQQPFYRAAADLSLVQGEPVIIEDVAAEYGPRLGDPLYQDPLRRAGLEVTLKHYRSLLKTPLFLKGQIFGAITFHFAESRTFSEEDLRLAATLADQAMLAIENARLIEKVKETAVLAERSRLARELHDAVTQTLFSTTLMAEVLPKIWEKDPVEGRKKLNELRELTRGALAEMRTLLVELRPTALQDADLQDLLRHLVNAFIARARIPARLLVEGGQELPLDVKIAFYRVAQEALNNIARHAEAGQVVVTLREDENELFMQIEDDGIGFEPGEQRPDHFGLNIMHERAGQVGAELRIHSRPGEGTCVWMRRGW